MIWVFFYPVIYYFASDGYLPSELDFFLHFDYFHFISCQCRQRSIGKKNIHMPPTSLSSSSMLLLVNGFIMNEWINKMVNIFIIIFKKIPVACFVTKLNFFSKKKSYFVLDLTDKLPVSLFVSFIHIFHFLLRIYIYLMD